MKKSEIDVLIKKAIIMRLAGATLATISERTGISSSTLKRQFKKNNVIPNDITTESVLKAREALIQDATFIERLKLSVATSIHDDLALSRKIRDAVSIQVDRISGDVNTPASTQARSLAGLSTAVRLTQEIQRKALSLDRYDPYHEAENLPQLIITKMTEEEIKDIQKNLLESDEYA
jgi:hypothetical protein